MSKFAGLAKLFEEKPSGICDHYHIVSPQRLPVYRPVFVAMASAANLVCFALRLLPGQELVAALNEFVVKNSLRAAFILTCVGSARKATIRLASATPEKPNEIIELNEFFEIVSLVGTITNPSMPHLHISLADKNGRVVGGHLLSMIVYTTAEILIGECAALTFQRLDCPHSGWDELVVSNRTDQ